MPDMDGVEALRTFKADTSTSDIPGLVISSLSEKNGVKLIQEGAAGYFEKGSMTPETLENAIAGILNEGRNVLGMMPHPENHVEEALGCTDGRALFAGLARTLSDAA